MKKKISISIVIFKPDISLLINTINSLMDSLEYAYDSNLIKETSLFLINNRCSNKDFQIIKKLLNRIKTRFDFSFFIINGHGNVGYGKGHNLALENLDSELHLVLNPDVFLTKQVIASGIKCLSDDQTGMVAPFIIDKNDNLIQRCVKYPSIIFFLLRAFNLKILKKIFNKYLQKFYLDFSGNENSDLTVSSGCFMFFKTDLLKKVKGFDERYFLYFEDFDLCLKSRRYSKIVLNKNMLIKHYGGNTSLKGLKHKILFLKSMMLFFYKNKINIY